MIDGVLAVILPSYEAVKEVYEDIRSLTPAGGSHSPLCVSYGPTGHVIVIDDFANATDYQTWLSNITVGSRTINQEVVINQRSVSTTVVDDVVSGRPELGPCVLARSSDLALNEGTVTDWSSNNELIRIGGEIHINTFTDLGVLDKGIYYANVGGSKIARIPTRVIPPTTILANIIKDQSYVDQIYNDDHAIREKTIKNLVDINAIISSS